MDFLDLVNDMRKEIGVEEQMLCVKEREDVYALAYGKYQRGEYALSAHLFTKLVLHDPYDTRFWKGLAGARQMQKDFKGAVYAWGVLSLLGNHPPQAHYHAAECFLSMGELGEAKKALDCAKLYLDKNDPLVEKVSYLEERVSAC